MKSPDPKRQRTSDVVTDREPRQYRREGTHRLWHFSNDTIALWVTIAGVLGAAFIFIFSVWFPTEPRWLIWAIGLAPGPIIPIVCDLLEGTPVRRATETEDQVPAEIGASKEAETAEDGSRDRLPKGHSDRTLPP